MSGSANERRQALKPNDFSEPVRRLYQHLNEIGANLAYIQRELPRQRVDDNTLSAIAEIVAEFDSALYDVRKEVRTLEDKLGMHPGQAPFDPDVVEPNPKVTLAMIENWLVRELESMHSLVKQLERDSEGEPAKQQVYVLVGESGANIFNSFAAIKDLIEFIRSKL